ncbi:MAG: YceI family protein [Myxococcota bacterium]
MASYRVDSARSQVRVRTRSSFSDTVTTWDRVSGVVEADPETVDSAGASARFSVDMTSFDAGDWLRNRKLRSHFAMAQHPTATFELTGLRRVSRGPDGDFSAIADGDVYWRGRQLAVSATGRATMDERALEANASFDLDIRELGVEPPRFLMFSVASEVAIEIVLYAQAD